MNTNHPLPLLNWLVAHNPPHDTHHLITDNRAFGLDGYLIENQHKITPEIAAQLLGTEAPASERKKLHTKTLEILFRVLTDQDFRHLTQNCPSSTAAWQIIGSDVAVRRLDPETKHELTQHPNPHVRVQVASHPAFTRHEQLEALAVNRTKPPHTGLGIKLGKGKPTLKKTCFAAGWHSTGGAGQKTQTDHGNIRRLPKWVNLFNNLEPWTNQEISQVLTGLDTKSVGPPFLMWLSLHRPGPLDWAIPHLPWVQNNKNSLYPTTEGLNLPTQINWILSWWHLTGPDGHRFPGAAIHRNGESILHRLLTPPNDQYLNKIRYQELRRIVSQTTKYSYWKWENKFIEWCDHYPHLKTSQQTNDAAITIIKTATTDGWFPTATLPKLKHIPHLITKLEDTAPIQALIWAIPDLTLDYIKTRRPDIHQDALLHLVETQPDLTIRDTLTIL